MSIIMGLAKSLSLTSLPLSFYSLSWYVSSTYTVGGLQSNKERETGAEIPTDRHTKRQTEIKRGREMKIDTNNYNDGWKYIQRYRQ